jgi:hypothetical protein
MRARHLITAGCLVAAIGFYVIGAGSIAALMLLGVAFEMAFWIRIGSARKQP